MKFENLSAPFHWTMVYELLADFVLLLHLAFIVFVVFGGLLVLKNVKWAGLHVPAALWGSFVEFAGWICPLTPLENGLYLRAGAGTYQESFIAHYLMPLIYPAGLTRHVQVGIGVGIFLMNLFIYALAIYRHRKTFVKKTTLLSKQ